ILARAKMFGGDDFVFPGRRTGSPLSNMALLMAVRRLGFENKATVHGFRSSFRDWASDNQFSSEASEIALAHVIKNKTEAAYRRGDLLEQRRKLMAAWATFVLEEPGGNVVQLRVGHKQ